MYEPNQNKWRIMSKLLRPRAFLSCCALGEKFIYIFGGRDSNTGKTVTDMERLSIDGITGLNWNNSWERVDL